MRVSTRGGRAGAGASASGRRRNQSFTASRLRARGRTAGADNPPAVASHASRTTQRGGMRVCREQLDNYNRAPFRALIRADPMPRHQMCGVGLKKGLHSLVENPLTQEGTLSAGLILRERVSYVEQ